MHTKLTVNQYITNPLGKGAASSALKIVKTEYDARYDALLDIHDEFETHIYKGRSSYFFHIMIPSEALEGIIYDIVVKVTRGLISMEADFRNWEIKVISNSPSFVFTYAYAFKKNGSIIDELSSIIPKKSITDAAKMRNPYKLLGIEKTMYYACKYIKDKFSSTADLDLVADKINIKQLAKDIEPFDEVMKNIKIEQKKKSVARKKEQKKIKKLNNTILQSSEQVIDGESSSQTKPDIVRTTTTTKSAKKSSIVGKSKKTKRK